MSTAITPLRARMIEDMNARKLGSSTQKGHIHSCKRFAAFLNRSPDTATAEARSPVSDAPLCRFRATVNTVWALIRQGMGSIFLPSLELQGELNLLYNT